MTVSEAKRLKALDRAMVRHWSEDNGEGEWQAEAVAGGTVLDMSAMRELLAKKW